MFERAQVGLLQNRLAEKRRFMQVLIGARQVGKTTLVRQVMEKLPFPAHYASADGPAPKETIWIEQQWDAARLLAKDGKGALLVLDEVQKVGQWSEVIKKHWDEDTRQKCPLKVVLLGSSSLLLQTGLTESLTGRFEIIHVPHWSFAEMKEAFGFTLDQFIFYGGYPGAAGLIDDPDRWKHYVLDSLIETTISRDILMMTRVDKPVLLRRLFELGCSYSGQILSYQKMMGQLHDAGNATTLAHYLELLSVAGMLAGLPKFTPSKIRQRSSSPKLQVLNTALITAQGSTTFKETQKDRDQWGRLVESAVGAHLLNSTQGKNLQLSYWRERNQEVDFVLSSGKKVAAFEVKSGRAPTTHSGMEIFAKRFKPQKKFLIGSDGIPLEQFFSTPAEEWLS